MTDHYDFLLKLRAIREYDSVELSDDDLGAILEAGRWTGSSKNSQDWAFVVVTEPDRLRRLAGFGTYTTPIQNSVATIVLVQKRGGNSFDIGRAAQNMMLAAKAVGVASCPITLHKADGARDFVGGPKGSTVRYAIALGYPSHKSVPARRGGRKKPSQVIKLERY